MPSGRPMQPCMSPRLADDKDVMNKTTRNIIALVILAILLIIVIAMNMGGDINSAEIRPVAEGSAKAPGSGVKIGNTQ